MYVHDYMCIRVLLFRQIPYHQGRSSLVVNLVSREEVTELIKQTRRQFFLVTRLDNM